jgi:hypothetical protein
VKAAQILEALVEDAPALDEFTRAYIECALWSSNDESTPQGGEPMDANYSIDDIAPEALAGMAEDCRKFQEQFGVPAYNRGDYTDEEMAGHDFWLTRNGHGAGFWDRSELDEATRKKYTDAAHGFGECNLYVGDDGKIYCS